MSKVKPTLTYLVAIINQVTQTCTSSFDFIVDDILTVIGYPGDGGNNQKVRILSLQLAIILIDTFSGFLSSKAVNG